MAIYTILESSSSLSITLWVKLIKIGVLWSLVYLHFKNPIDWIWPFGPFGPKKPSNQTAIPACRGYLHPILSVRYAWALGVRSAHQWHHLCAPIRGISKAFCEWFNGKCCRQRIRKSLTKGTKTLGELNQPKAPFPLPSRPETWNVRGGLPFACWWYSIELHTENVKKPAKLNWNISKNESALDFFGGLLETAFFQVSSQVSR